jgi:hypothetical protein
MVSSAPFASNHNVLLITAEVIAHRDDALEHSIPAKLLGESVYMAVLELWAEENVRHKGNLNTDADMLLEVVRASHGILIAAANGDPNALVLKLGETSVGAADSAFESQGKALIVDRRIDAIEIIELLAILEGTVIALGRLKVEFPSKPEAFAKHCIATKAHEKATEGRIPLAGRVGW